MATRSINLAELLAQQDAAKARLTEIGIGHTGLPWPELVEAIDNTIASYANALQYEE